MIAVAKINRFFAGRYELMFIFQTGGFSEVGVAPGVEGVPGVVEGGARRVVDEVGVEGNTRICGKGVAGGEF